MASSCGFASLNILEKSDKERLIYDLVHEGKPVELKQSRLDYTETKSERSN